MEKRFITYLGFGRGGIRTLDIVEKNMENADYMVCDTGYFHLRKSKIKNKILLTKETTSSISKKSIEAFELLMAGRFVVFFVGSLGGESGSHILPELLQSCAKLKIKTVCILSKPFHFEGTIKKEISDKSERLIRELATSVLVLENETCRELCSTLRLENAFHTSHHYLARICKHFEVIICEPGQLCIDFAELLYVLRLSAKTIISDGISTGNERLLTAFQNACTSPLFSSHTISNFDKIFMYYQCSSTQDIQMDEIKQIHQIIQELPDATIFWNFSINENLDDKVTVILIASISDKHLTLPQS